VMLHQACRCFNGLIAPPQAPEPRVRGAHITDHLIMVGSGLPSRLQNACRTAG